MLAVSVILIAIVIYLCCCIEVVYFHWSKDIFRSDLLEVQDVILIFIIGIIPVVNIIGFGVFVYYFTYKLSEQPDQEYYQKWCVKNNTLLYKLLHL
jgi:heme/copper-type cytochrome/quinol oxidase subunit 2